MGGAVGLSFDDRLTERRDALWELLDQALDRPLRIERGLNWVEVWVFESFCFRHDFDAGTIAARRVAFDGHIVPQESGRVRLSPVLGAGGFAHFVEESARINDASGPGCDDQPYYPSIYRRLRRDARFQRMRLVDIPNALGLDQDVMRLARASRLYPDRGQVRVAEYEFAFRHRDVLQREWRRSPRLLPWLADIAREQHCEALPGDVLLRRFLDAGLSRRSFAYARRVGMRWARPLLSGTRPDERTAVLIGLFELLDRAGRPAHVDARRLPRFVREALRLNGGIGMALPRLFREPWARAALPRLLSMVLTAPAQAVDQAISDVAVVGDECTLGRIIPRRKEPVAQLIKRARRSAEDAGRLSAAARVQSEHDAPAYHDEETGLSFVPMRDGREVVAAGLKLRNCLVDQYEGYLSADRLIVGIYLPGQKLIGCTELTRRGAYWTLGRVAGFANSDLDLVAVAAANRYASTVNEDSTPIANLLEAEDESIWLCHLEPGDSILREPLRWD